MNGIFITVLLSGLLLHPAALIGEKDYILSWQDKVDITQDAVTITLPNSFRTDGLMYLLHDAFGSQGFQILAWIEAVQDASSPASAGLKDYTEHQRVIGDRTVTLKVKPQGMVLTYERGFG